MGRMGSEWMLDEDLSQVLRVLAAKVAAGPPARICMVTVRITATQD
jgi:hypothetical protein